MTYFIDADHDRPMTYIILVVCCVLCAEVVSATSSEGFLIVNYVWSLAFYFFCINFGDVNWPKIM